MQGNCEKMLLISSPTSTNEWSSQQQNNQIVDDQKGGCLNNNMTSVAAAATSGVIMDQKVGNITQEQMKQAQNQEALRCPRCDSTNTKFCYYNNYSLSQPRHFCKACKRYWTRGGTLRNVPVGGGCRKNKRVRRPSCNNTTNHHNTTLEGSVTSSAGGHTFHDLISSASNHVNPLFYGHTSEINFPFSRYDLHHQSSSQSNGLGLGFSSSSGLLHNTLNNGDHSHGEFRNHGLNINNLQSHLSSNSKQIFQDLISSNPLLSNYATTTTTTHCTTPSTISSLLASMKSSANNNFQTILPSSYEDSLHLKGIGGQVSNSSSEVFMKEVKMEYGGQNRPMNHHWSSSTQNHQMDETNMGSSSSDPSVIWGSGPNLGAWLDPSSNLGSSVTSLI